MGMYKHIRNLWKQPKKNMPELWRERLIAWRKDPVTLRIEKPTRIDRARSLGYKAKQGYIVVRQRVIRGGHKRPKIRKGRRSKRYHQKKNLDLSYQTIAERRANSKFLNCEVLNSYFVAQDGRYYWYEVILIDTSHPVIKADKNMKWITSNKQKGRVHRGLTSSAKKSRRKLTM
ncbi:50S ribosomal protein L15e [Candidatus Woesearchaeota archaeon B3_Woes]|nr:MAG: 50S ribosomal protein L15e [Candidatus Woesearchaeota archaeon B3_Woes]